jgi:glycosyltransferase involved in cell wall biosynthesis
VNALVSVIIPVYNRPTVVLEAVRSVFASNWRPLEVIVIDDGSTDETYDNLISLDCPGNLEYRVLRQDNSGASTARNKGLSVSRGRYIQFLDSDDLLLPEKLAEQIDRLENQNLEVVYGDWWQGSSWADKKYIKGYETKSLLCDLLRGRWLPNFSFLYRREVVERIGGWDENFGLNDDFDFALRIAASTSQIGYCPKATGLYRWHSGERLSRKSRQAIARANLEILAKVEETNEPHTIGSQSTASLQSCLASAYYRSARGLSPRDRYAVECHQRAENLAPDRGFLPAWCRWIARISLKSAYGLDYVIFALKSGARSIARRIYRSLKPKIM